MPIETVRSVGADREAAWASEGLRAAFADLMTKESPLERSEKTSLEPERCREPRGLRKTNKRASVSWQSAECGQGKTNAGTEEVVRSRLLRAGRRHTHDDKPLGAVAGYIIGRFGTLVYSTGTK